MRKRLIYYISVLLISLHACAINNNAKEEEKNELDCLTSEDSGSVRKADEKERRQVISALKSFWKNRTGREIDISKYETPWITRHGCTYVVMLTPADSLIIGNHIFIELDINFEIVNIEGGK